MTVFGTYQIMSSHAQTIRLKHSRISMFEVQAVPHSCVSQVQIGLDIVCI
jgi:hypothetical protein